MTRTRIFKNNLNTEAADLPLYPSLLKCWVFFFFLPKTIFLSRTFPIIATSPTFLGDYPGWKAIFFFQRPSSGDKARLFGSLILRPFWRRCAACFSLTVDLIKNASFLVQVEVCVKEQRKIIVQEAANRNVYTVFYQIIFSNVCKFFGTVGVLGVQFPSYRIQYCITVILWWNIVMMWNLFSTYSTYAEWHVL